MDLGEMGDSYDLTRCEQMDSEYSDKRLTLDERLWLVDFHLGHHAEGAQFRVHLK
jgi:hypothetical protein